MLLVQMSSGWEKPWVEQIVDRIMKGTLKTTEERAKGVVRHSHKKRFCQGCAATSVAASDSPQHTISQHQWQTVQQQTVQQ